MKKYGLLGKKLGHSYSPEIHKMLGGYDYGLFECMEDELDAFFAAREFQGINVTTPYKKAVIPYCDELSPEARKIGSVNTIIKLPDGRLRGENTDYAGFVGIVRRSAAPLDGKILVLGNGGVAPTIRTALADMGAENIITVSRSGENNYVNLRRHFDAKLIVNATPLGMYPNNGAAAVDLRQFPCCECVLDPVYNPARTRLMLDAEKLGINSCGGLYMLVEQAVNACRLFTGKVISPERTEEVYEIMSIKMLNVALIGMPGCGKTSVGEKLAALSGRPFADIDAEIEKRIAMSIPEYFSLHGESAFREVETEVLAELSKRSGLVIACGGGVVTRSENYGLLHQNSTIVYIKRGLDELPSEGRPLSLAHSPAALAEKRLPLYEAWCDISADNSGSIADAANSIARMLKL